MEAEVKLTLRLPASLHRRIVELARRDRRSLNGQLVVLLERAAVRAERQQAGDEAE